MRAGHRRADLPVCAALTFLLLAPLASACTELEVASAEGYVPATVEEIDGAEVSRVTLTQEGADRVDLETTTVGTVGDQLVIDYAALIYDGQGASWVYTTPEPLTFLREAVVVDRIDGQSVLLTSGPPSGTEIVTVGSTEVYGAELNIAGDH